MIFVTGGSGFIGSHLVSKLINSNSQFINLDIAPPENEIHRKFWIDCNILDYEVLDSIFKKYRPSAIVNLAAQTHLWNTGPSDHLVNTKGVENLCNISQKTLSIECFISVSTQHVTKPGFSHKLSVGGSSPYADYGLSKSIGEIIVRDSNLSHWTIVRPTNVWGPGSSVLKHGLCHEILSNRYFHPKNDCVIRGYSYVENLVVQLIKLMELPSFVTNRKIYYLADANLSQYMWVNTIHERLKGTPVRQIPKIFLHSIAMLGSLLNLLNIDFPLSLPRYANLTTSNPVPLESTFEEIGEPIFDFEEAIDRTVTWILQSRSNNE